MEVELEARVKALPYKIRGMSRESPTQKALHVLDSDLRSHWSTGTNTKEWILLELEEACLLSHIRIHNKSVLEWEIAVGLRYKPDTFLKVRPRCEAPRRDMMYPINYLPCRFVRISCLRGNPIAIFFVQLIGVPVPGLEQEFQPVIDYLLPHIVSHKQDTHDIYLQLLQDITCRLSPFLAQLESELSNFADAVDSNIRFLAMLAGPFYPILCIVGERESTKVAGGIIDLDTIRGNQGILTISSNFQAQPRRVRAPTLTIQLTASSLVFRPDAVLLLLRKAYKDSHLGNVCRSVAGLLRKLTAPGCSPEVSSPLIESMPLSGSEDITAKGEVGGEARVTDYSNLFGEEFKIFEDTHDVNISNVLDVAAVEEGLLHIIYACASQPIICRRLGDTKTDLLPALPFIQAMLPALRPTVGSTSNSDQVDETFWQWQNPLVQHSLTQIAAVSSSSSYQPLLDACAGYLSSFSPAHARAACVLLDLCSGPLAPWIPMVIAKVDLTIELVEDLLGVIQNAQHAIAHARAALIYIMLALSGHMDDDLPKFKDVKHSLLFLIEMLEPFLVPAITTVKNTIAFGDVSAVFLEKQEKICAIALDLLHTAVQRPAVLPALENEWRRGTVEPSVLLSILAPHVPLPPGINLRKSSMTKGIDHEVSTSSPVSSDQPTMTISKAGGIEEDADGKSDMVDGNSRNDASEDGSILFAPADLKNTSLRKFSTPFEGNIPETQGFGPVNLKVDGKPFKEKDSIPKNKLNLDLGCAEKYFDLQREYLQLVNHQDRELRASEFSRFAEELHGQSEINLESHDAAIDALLLAAECHLNPYFMMACSESEQLMNRIIVSKDYTSSRINGIISDPSLGSGGKSGVQIISQLEGKRDKTVIDILIQAAKWDRKIHNVSSIERSLEHKSIDYEFEERPYGIKIFPDDVQSADAVTLVRQHQSLICGFLVRQLQREQHNMYEVLLHGLLFFLYSATHVSCHPGNVVDVILQSAERLNRLIFSLHHEQKETSPLVEPAKVHRARRQWALLQRIVFAASGNGIMEEDYRHSRKGFWYRNLIPVSSWIDRISKFSSSPLPLVRYIGWMGLARYAKECSKRGFFLTQDMREMTRLLSIFSDELISVKYSFKGKGNEELQEACFLEFNAGKLEKSAITINNLDPADGDGVVHAFYPEMDVVFPDLRKQFFTYAEIMLEVVCSQVKEMPPNSIPDILSWFSEFCSNPFLDIDRDQNTHVDASNAILNGVVVSNVKCILLHILEVIILEHMEAIIPEIPRVIQVLLSLCNSSYCDVPLLDSVLSVLKPLISYTISTATASEKFVEDDPSSMNFESLCFDALINQLESGPEQKKGTMANISQGALLIFLAGSLLSDLSISRRRQLMQSLLQWAKFTSFQATSTYYNYLCAFQVVLKGCNSLVQETLRELGISLTNEHLSCLKKDPIDFICKDLSVLAICERGDKKLDLYGVERQEERSLLVDSFQVKDQENAGDDDIIEHGTKRAGRYALQHFSFISDVEDFTKSLQELIFTLSPTLEICWKFHSQMACKLSQMGAACLLYSGSLVLNYQFIHSNKAVERNGACQIVSESEQMSNAWQSSLEGLGQAVLTLQQNHCWQVSAVLLDYLLSLPFSFSLDGVLGPICSAVLLVCCHAPKITWRLQTGKWLEKLFERDSLDFSSSSSSLVELFCTMLEHSEPEQRYTALQHLGRVVGHEELGRLTASSISGSLSTNMSVVMGVKRVSQRGVASTLVANTWDRIASLAACEQSMTLRREAMKLLERFIPFAEPYQLRSFFGSVDAILPGLGMPSYSMREGPLTVLGLSVLARACLYSEDEDIDIIPPSVWDNLELLAKSNNGGAFIQAEQDVCCALLHLKEHREEAKEVLKEALERSSESTQLNPDLSDVRESVLQVLARLNSIRSKSDGLTEFYEKETQELEDAEIELELIQEEKTLQEGFKNISQSRQTISGSSRLPVKSTHQRLQELKTQIRDMERSETRAEIAARREREHIARRIRQVTLEEAALREIELLQEIDRERIAEVEREVERQKLLEKEHAKTRELRHSLDLEVERRTQREIQRELEQRESGLRSSRREFSTSTPSSRPRERYREREGGRPAQEGSLRPGSSGSGVRENGTAPPATPTASVSNASVTSIGAISSTPTIVTNSSRIYPVQMSPFSHTRDRGDERGYEDSFDGMREIGDAGSIGDPDTGSTMDMMASGSFGAPHRQGSRSTKPRQIVERRERDARREGKWERKQC